MVAMSPRISPGFAVRMSVFPPLELMEVHLSAQSTKTPRGVLLFKKQERAPAG